MEPIYVMIDAAETGNHIRRLMDERGLSIRDVQEACGFVGPQSVYNWLSGKKLPRLDNMIILSKLLNTPIDSILVTNEDVFLCCYLPTTCPRGLLSCNNLPQRSLKLATTCPRGLLS